MAQWAWPAYFWMCGKNQNYCLFSCGSKVYISSVLAYHRIDFISWVITLARPGIFFVHDDKQWVKDRDGSIVSISSIISAIPILSVSYRIGVSNIGFFDISISYR